MLGSGGVVPIPCSVWDTIFQNLDTDNQTKVCCATNSAFNEIAWFYPSSGGSGENDSYVKAHIEGGEYQWDYGVLSRTAWLDISILGMPIGTASDGTVYQHETGTTITGVSLPSFQSGWWAISDGNDLSFVDFIVPDFIWGLRSGLQDAQVNMTFYTADYPGDSPVSHGPYTVTQATEYLNVRMGGRLMSVLVQSNSQSFWRLGRIRFRYSVSGRR